MLGPIGELSVGKSVVDLGWLWGEIALQGVVCNLGPGTYWYQSDK